MESFEAYEYVIVPKKRSAKTVKKILFIALYVLFVIAWLLFGVVSNMPALLALIPLTTWMLVYATWKYVNVEYEYSVAGPVITFSKIYGSRSRKYLGELDVRTVDELLPLSSPFAERRLDGFDPEAADDFTAGRDSETAYAAIYVDEDGVKCAVYLEILTPLMSTFKLYNTSAIKKLDAFNREHTH